MPPLLIIVAVVALGTLLAFLFMSFF